MDVGGMKIVPIYGVFQISRDKDVEDKMLMTAASEEGAAARAWWLAKQTGNFIEDYYYRRIDQQEFDEAAEGLIFIGDTERDVGSS